MNLTQKMAYLKHVGKLQDVKVTVTCNNDLARYEIHIHDHVFYTFDDALNYLKRDAAGVILNQQDITEVI